MRSKLLFSAVLSSGHLPHPRAFVAQYLIDPRMEILNFFAPTRHIFSSCITDIKNLAEANGSLLIASTIKGNRTRIARRPPLTSAAGIGGAAGVSNSQLISLNTTLPLCQIQERNAQYRSKKQRAGRSQTAGGRPKLSWCYGKPLRLRREPNVKQSCVFRVNPKNCGLAQ